MKWTHIDEELPPPNTKVKVSYGLIGTRAAVVDDWVSEGWILKSGIWSIKWKDGMPKYPNPTHWKFIEENE